MEYSNVVYIIIVIILLYYLITWYLADSTEMVAIHGTNEELTISEEKAGKVSEVNCAYSIWIFVGEYGDTVRNIFKRDDILMKLNKNNELLLDINTGTTPLTETPLTETLTHVDKLSIPLQKWVNIIISFESQYLTVYID